VGVPALFTCLEKNMVNFPMRGWGIVAKICPELKSCENGTARFNYTIRTVFITATHAQVHRPGTWIEGCIYPFPLEDTKLRDVNSTVCPQSPFGVLKNCGAQTNWANHMRFWQIIVKLWKFFFPPTDGISGHLYVSQSVVCEMATVQVRALCGMAF
jgi:hypothetical protein